MINWKACWNTWRIMNIILYYQEIFLYQVRKLRFEWNPMIWSVGNPFSIMHECTKYTNGWSKIFCWKIWRNLQHSIVCLQSGIGCISGSKGFVQMCCSFHLFWPSLYYGLRTMLPKCLFLQNNFTWIDHFDFWHRVNFAIPVSFFVSVLLWRAD